MLSKQQIHKLNLDMVKRRYGKGYSTAAGNQPYMLAKKTAEELTDIDCYTIMIKLNKYVGTQLENIIDSNEFKETLVYYKGLEEERCKQREIELRAKGIIK